MHLEKQIRSCAARDDWRFAATLALVIAVVFHKVLLGVGTFVIRDYSIFAYPLAHYHHASFWGGEIPLWNPYNNFGIPFLAQWSTLVLYPGSLIYLLLPLPWSLGFYCLVHLWFGGFGMYLLARHWTAHPLSAAIAGLAFAFNGFTLNCLTWPAFLAAMMWIPWVVRLVVESWTGDRKKLVWAVFAGASQMMTGAPEVIFLTWLLLACLWLKEIIRPAIPGRRPAFLLPIAVLLVAALSAAQLLPFFDLLAQSQRSALYADSTWSMPKWGWANLLVPLFRFYRAPNGVFFQLGQDWTSSYYLGVGVLLLAIVALLCVRETKVWVLCGLSAAALLLALGDNSPAYPSLRKALPQLGFMRFPIKFVLFAAFAFPLLAAFGARWLFETAPQSPRKSLRWLCAVGATLAIAIVGILFYAKNHAVPNENWPATLRSGLGRIIILAVMVGAGFASWKAAPQLRKVSLGLLLLLFVLDPITHAPSQNPAVPLSVYEVGLAAQKMTPAPVLGLSRAMMTRPTHDTLYSSMLANVETDYLGRRLGLFGNSSLIDRIPNVDGFYSLYLLRPREVWSALFFGSDTNALTGLSDFLGISHFSHPTEFLSWARRDTALPLITAGQKVLTLTPPEILRHISSTNFNPREVVYLSDLGFGHAAVPGVLVTNLSVSAHSISVTLHSLDPTIAVIAQSFHPLWTATVNGVPTRIRAANYAFQAVPIPAGTVQLRLEYRDRTFTRGAWVSATTLILLLAIRFFPSSKTRHPPLAQPAGWD